ncbi:MAG TPA: aminofutalosine synthase MqnE [Verrucomicrobiae bacterium]|jgi:aminodeoxyfutalosine synthase|nr:aminofutalosine synthase MqnE [Verrucomicrobiae bacterium]
MSFFDYGPLQDIAEKVEAGEQLSFEDGVRLYRTNDLPLLGSLAQTVRRRINGNRVFYSINLHVNHTNVCTLRCLFCAFARRPGEEGGYTFSTDEIQDKVRQGIAKWQINEVHIVGGHNPDLGLDYYVDMFRKIREAAPSIYIKALTAPEIDDLAHRTGLSYRDVLAQLQAAGLDGLPGGGAEIFHPVTRRKICHEKIDADTWLAIHEIAHELGLRTNATMLYGHIESDEDRVDHVLRLRELQAKTKGFYSFIPLAYNSDNNPLQKLGEAGGFLDVKVYAVSRLLFDNIPHIKAHWITTGLKMGQVALSFGVDDLGGTNLNEKIVHDAGSETPVDLSQDEMVRLIRDAGYEPCLVDSSYQFVG